MEIVDSLQKNLKTNIGGDHPSQYKAVVEFHFFSFSIHTMLYHNKNIKEITRI